MTSYYADKLAAQRLQLCYEIAPPRVQQYLQAEIEHVRGRMRPADAVLELGCGYGRVLRELARRAGFTVGVDTSTSSLGLAREFFRELANCHLLAMDAVALGFKDGAFDLVACVQNGISAFKVDQQSLVRESLRVTRPGGRVLFSSYSARFWRDRLEWFELQAEHGLVGEVDHGRTRDGVIVCKDGFQATTVTPDGFRTLAASLDLTAVIEEVDGSSIFCEIRKI